MNESNMGILYIVATPIGNLEDITLRALRILREVDIIACEDTRNSGMLLKHFDIKKPLVSYFQHSQVSKVDYIIDELKNGKNIALITDAGTPGISDPGQELIAKIRELSIINYQLSINGQVKNNQLDDNWKSQNDILEPIKIVPIPGASALTAAASVSGLIEKEFYFAGFLPKKKGRQTQFKAFSKFECPIVIYESTMRLTRTLGDIRTYLGDDCEVFIAREITKMFEEYWGGKVAEVLEDLKSHQLKGEVVLIVKRAKS